MTMYSVLEKIMFGIRKLLVILLVMSACCTQANAEETVTLEKDANKLKLETGVVEQVTDAIQNSDSMILKGAVDSFSEDGIFSPDGMTFESGPIKSTKFGVAYDSSLTMRQAPNKEFSGRYDFNGVDIYNKTKYRDGKTESMIMINPLRIMPDTQNSVTEKISEFSVTHKFNAHQAILVGQGKRLPIGVEGQPLSFFLDTVNRSQIARTFSNTRSIGVRNLGTYKYADYDIGIYDGTRYLQELFHGQEFVGWVNVKPLANLNEKKYGKLTLGTGLQTGHEKYNYDVIGAYADYKYKKFEANFECANANGYNALTPSNKKAGGYYTTLLYNVHPKVQLVARYDVFDPDRTTFNNNVTEYTAGVNYFVNKRIKLLANYVRQDKPNTAGSNMFMFATRVLF